MVSPNTESTTNKIYNIIVGMTGAHPDGIPLGVLYSEIKRRETLPHMDYAIAHHLKRLELMGKIQVDAWKVKYGGSVKFQ